MSPLRSPAESFFNAHAEATPLPGESQREARRRNARELAAAEEVLRNGPYFVWFEPDDEPAEGAQGPVWAAMLYTVERSTEAEHIVTLHGLMCPDRSPYLRVVAAELARDYLPDPA